MSYAPQTSFAAFQATQPTDPLPGASLDIELDAISTELARLLAFVADIRREDANLQNGKVTFDALNAELQLLFRPRSGVPILDGGDELVAVNGISVPDINPASFATQTEAEAGVANDRLMTPLRTAQAVVSQRPFASQSQAQAGTSETTVLSPARGVDLLDALRGRASQAQAEAGTSSTTVMSPLRSAQALSAQRPAVKATVSLTWGEISANDSATQDITVTGAAAGDAVAVGYPAAGLDDGLVPVAWVSAADTVTLRLLNVTSGAITPFSGSATSLTVYVTRF